MNVLEAIAKRRSIRKFTDRPVSQEQTNALLKAAMFAPTAHNRQEWEFVVVRDRALLNRLTEIHPYAQMLASANCALVVCADITREAPSGYWPGDCGAATQNILLAATELGLGSVWLGVYPNEKRMNDIAALLELPKNVLPFNIIALGYPNETKEDVERFDPAKVHYEKW